MVNKKSISVLLVATMLMGILFADTDTLIEPVSDSDLKVISNDGTVLWLLDDIDSAFNKLDLTFEGIQEHPTNCRLDFFIYSNDDIELALHRAWKFIYSIVLKSDAFHLNRGIKIGDSVESIHKSFQELEVFKMDGGFYIRYASKDEGSRYYFPNQILFKIEDDIIVQITLMSTHD